MNAPDELAVELRRSKVLELQIAGKSYRQIAEELTVSLGTVASDMKALVERAKAENDDRVERERMLSLARNGKALAVVLPMLNDGETVKDAVDALDKLEKRRAALLGLDAPTRQELSGPKGAPIEIDGRAMLVERLAGLVAGDAPAGEEGRGPPKPDAG